MERWEAAGVAGRGGPGWLASAMILTPADYVGEGCEHGKARISQASNHDGLDQHAWFCD
jgi:hypothetical protein